MSKDYKDLLVALDIGTSKVVAIVAELKGEGHYEVIGLGQSESKGLKKGVVVNIEATVQSIQRALEEAELMADCKITNVFTGIAGSHIRSFNSSGMVAIKEKEVTQTDVGARDRDGEGDQHPDRSAGAAHPDAGIHHRRSGRCARADRHERHPAGSEGAYRDRRGERGAEHREVRAPLRARSERSDPAAAGVVAGGADGRRKGTRRGAGRYRRRHDGYRDFQRRRDSSHGGDSDRRRPDHQRHRDGAAYADAGRGRHQGRLRHCEAGSSPIRTR